MSSSSPSLVRRLAGVLCGGGGEQAQSHVEWNWVVTPDSQRHRSVIAEAEADAEDNEAEVDTKVERVTRASETTCVVCYDRFRPELGVSCREGHFLCGGLAPDNSHGDSCLSGRDTNTYYPPDLQAPTSASLVQALATLTYEGF
jgi:hypothetical protein